jgi:ribonuclease H-related protein
MSKYYAVRKGRKIGVFSSWDDCKKQVEGYGSAEYKSFSTLDEANHYLNLSNNNDSHELKSEETLKTLKAYVDGSYSKETDLYSYGCVLIDESITRLSGVGNDKRNSSLWNVAGELLGTMKAIKWAYQKKYEKIVIFHDYEGIAKWANGDWKANKEGTKEYINFIAHYKELISLQFIKVKAHSGDKYNEEADKLAKDAMTQYINNEGVIEEENTDIEKNDIEEVNLFRTIANEQEKAKDQFIFKIKGYQLTESKLKKFTKEVWRRKGYKVNQIASVNIKLETEKFKIEFAITDKEGKIHNFSFFID